MWIPNTVLRGSPANHQHLRLFLMGRATPGLFLSCPLITLKAERLLRIHVLLRVMVQSLLDTSCELTFSLTALTVLSGDFSKGRHGKGFLVWFGLLVIIGQEDSEYFTKGRIQVYYYIAS